MISTEIAVETCLVALTMISYALPSYTDMKMLLNETITNNIDMLLSEESILIRCRMCLLLGYY
jgi:hypothetical protein